MGFIGGLLNFLIVICSVFLIILVLIQRGRGGGLAGAFGGMGGSSAFGTKAGDVFTRVTVVTASIWFLLAMALVIINNQGRTSAFVVEGSGTSSREVTPTDTGPPPPAGAKSESSGASKPATAPTGKAASGDTTPAPATSPTGTSDLPEVFEPEPEAGAGTPTSGSANPKGASPTAGKTP